jgi:glycosyltransferase involved in cell wall biosynthesis
MPVANKLSSRKVKVVHLVRSVGPTSMPWNDLYSTARRIAPGVMYPPAVIGFPIGSFAKVRRIACHDKMRKYVSCNPFGALGYLWRVYRHEIRHGGTLVIHIHNPVIALVGLAAKLFFPRIKIVGNLHTDWSFLRLRHKAGLYLLATIANRFVSVSEASQDSIPESLKDRLGRAGRLAVIRNGIDPVKFGVGEAIVPAVSAETVAIVAARMAAPKNHSFILQLVADTPEIDKLIWFGDGELRPAIEAEIERLGIRSRVELKGRRPRSEVFDVLATGTIYLSASKWEGIGVANLEAAGLGCWPFLSKIPPHEEVASLLEIKTFSLSDSGEWRQGIIEYLSKSVVERMEMRKALADKTRHLFDLDSSIARYIDIYRELAESRVYGTSGGNNKAKAGRSYW